MKHLKYLISFIFLLINVFSFAQEILSWNGNKKYCDPTPGEISIMACSPITQGINPSETIYQDVVDCGFNLVTSQGSVEYFRQQFNLMGDLNLKYIVSTPNLLTNSRSSYISGLKNNKHFGGWLLKDEPAFDYLNTLKEGYDGFYSQDSNNFVLVNLVGELNKKFTGNFTEFSNYLDYIQQLLKPQVWSYDYYPILNKNGKLMVMYDKFYAALENFSKISKETQRPFWAFCESLAYKTKTYSRPAATENYFRFEAFSALAYGAQGIAYWTYGMRNSNPSETYTSALVDLKGKKTKAWYAAQTVNREIRKFNDVFKNSIVKEVRHTGNVIYKGTKKLSGNFGPLKMVRSGNAGVLVSLIENQGNQYVVIVNHDVLKKQKITLELETNRTLQAISLPNSPSYNWRNDISLTLDKGGYLIFKVME